MTRYSSYFEKLFTLFWFFHADTGTRTSTIWKRSHSK
nr:unnamed protein product [Callosobruchus analis]